MKLVICVFLLVLFATCAAIAVDQNDQNAQKDQPAKEKLVTINVVDADLRSVLSMIFEQAGISYSLAEDIQGTVTAYIGNQPLDTALRTILSPLGYVWRKDGSIYIVSKKKELPKSGIKDPILPTIPLDFDRDLSPKNEIRVERIPLNHIDAFELVDLIRGVQDSRNSRNIGPNGMLPGNGFNNSFNNGFNNGYNNGYYNGGYNNGLNNGWNSGWNNRNGINFRNGYNGNIPGSGTLPGFFGRR